MKAPIAWAVAACLLGGAAFAFSGSTAPARAADNPLLGSWTMIDQASGIHESLTVTPESFTFGSTQTPIPYRTVAGSGREIAVYLGEAEKPALFTVIDETRARLSVPDGPAIVLRREGAIAAAQGLVAQVAQSLEGAEPARTLSSPQSAVDEVIEARLPHAERTPYEPLKKSLDDLLEEGWELDQASGSLDGFTLLISNGGLRALCVLVPSELGQQDEALVDCRRLN